MIFFSLFVVGLISSCISLYTATKLLSFALVWLKMFYDKDRQKLDTIVYRRARFAKYRSVICETGPFWSFGSASSLLKNHHCIGVLLRSVKESVEITYISSQSSKNSFRKIQIFEFTNSTLPLFYSLFRFSHRGIWLLWYLICSFQYRFIRFVSHNTVSPQTCNGLDISQLLLALWTSENLLKSEYGTFTLVESSTFGTLLFAIKTWLRAKWRALGQALIVSRISCLYQF